MGRHDGHGIVVSVNAVSYTHLDVYKRQTWDTADYQPLLDRLEQGQRWACRLTANPVRSLPAGPGQRGQVKAHVSVAQQQDWLMRRAERCGFTIPDGPHGGPQVLSLIHI